MSASFEPPGYSAGDLKWPQAPHDVQMDEEWAVYYANVAFAAAFPTPTPQQLSAFQIALTKENEVDVAYIAAVNAALSASKSDFHRRYRGHRCGRRRSNCVP